MNNAPSKRQMAIVVKMLNKRGIVLQYGASYETLSKCIATTVGRPAPRSMSGQCALILDFLYDRIGVKPMPPLVPLKPQKGMAEQLARCAEYRREPSWFDKQRCAS